MMLLRSAISICVLFLTVASATAQVAKTGPIAALNDTVNLSTTDRANGTFQLTGTWVGTIQFEATVDGATWVALTVAPVPTAAAVSSATGNGLWTYSGAFVTIRARASAWTSGTATATALSTAAGGGGGGGGAAGSVTQGTNPWLTSVTAALPAGTNVIGHIICDSGCSGSGGTSSTFGAAIPAAGTAAGLSDGTNMQAPRVFDVDTGGGTQYVTGVNLRIGASGGSVEGGTSSNPVRTDPTGTTTQPVSGTVTANAAQSGTWTVQPGNTANTTAWKVDGSAVTQPVSGTVTTTPPSNASSNVAQFGGTNVTTGTGAGGAGIPRITVSNDSSFTANDTTTASTALGSANATINVALAGQVAVAFQLQSGGTGIYTVTPQCSYDGGTLYNTNGYIQDPVTGVVTLTAVIASAQATTNYPVMCPQGTSHVQMKVTAYTSGTANWLARATSGTWPGIVWGKVTTSAPTYTTGLIDTLSLNTSGGLRVDGSGVTQSVNVAQIAGTNTVTGGVAGLIAVGGNVANAGTATANPVPVGGIFTTTPATLTTGQTATLQFTAAQNAKHDLTTIAGTAPTTVGKIDVKGADGDVFVRQATATNLNAAVVGTGTAGSPAGNILTVQGVASMTKFLVTPDSVALPANQSVNVAQMNGVTTTMGNGVAGTGVQRVAIASDNTVLPGVGAGATGSAVPANAVYIGANVGANTTGVIGCGSSVVYDAATSGSTQLVAISGSTTIYVCGYSIIAAGTVNVKLVYGTGTNCATSPANITPAYQLTAQTGLVDGSPFFRGLKTTASQALCINASGAVAAQAIVYYTQF
jgi:hypothetical protein